MRLIMLLLPVSMFAQVVLTPNLPTSVSAGSIFQATVTQAGSDNVAEYQFTIALPSGISLTACTSLIVGKSAACQGSTGTVNVLLMGINTATLPLGGPSLSLSLKAASPMPTTSGIFSLIKTVATTPTAQGINSSGGSAAVTFINPVVPVTPPCSMLTSSKSSTGTFTISVICK